MATIKDRVRIVLQGDPILSSEILRGWPLHGWTHEEGGIDEISIDGLSGLTADFQRAGWLETYEIDFTDPPDTGDVLTYNGTVWVSAPGGISGLVEDQVLFGRADGTIDQSPAFTFDDTELYLNASIRLNDRHIEGIQYLDFVENGVTPAEGRMWRDSEEMYLVYGMPGGNVNLQIGGEQLLRGRNDSGSEIANGAPARIVGGVGINPTFDDLNITHGINCTYAGMATEDIANTQPGFLNTFGLVRDLNTSSLTLGAKTFWSTSNTLTHTQPPAGNRSIMAGYPTRIHATEGVFLHKPECIPFLSYLSDVNARGSTHTVGDILAWTGSYWDLETAVFSLDVDGQPGGPLAQNLTFYTSSGIIIDKAADGFIFASLGTPDIIYQAQTLNLVEGDYVSGAVADTRTVNQTGYVFQETTNTPGGVLDLNYTAVNAIDGFHLHVLYSVTAGGGHTIEVQLYNYNTTSFDSFTNFTTSVGYQTINLPVSDDTNYIDGSGNAILRFYHTSSGLTSHQLVVDYAVLIEQGTGTGAQAVLAEGAIGFGSDTNVLTGDAVNFRYNETDRRMLIGAGTPTHMTATQDSLFITGQLETTDDVHFTQDVYIYDRVRFQDDTFASFGNSQDFSFQWDTTQTVNSMFAWLPSAALSLTLAPVSAVAHNYALTAHTRPTLVLMGTTASADSGRRVELSHTNLNALLATPEGSIQFSDAYLTGSTNWASNAQLLYASVAEVDAIHALLGDAEGSVAAAILAAAATGGNTLDGAYDFGGAGAGRQLNATDGAPLFINYNTGSTSGNLALVRQYLAGTTTNTDPVLQIQHADAGTLAGGGSIDSILFSGAAGARDDYSSVGHRLYFEGAGSLYSDLTATYGWAQLRMFADSAETDRANMVLTAANDAGTQFSQFTLTSSVSSWYSNNGNITIHATNQINMTAAVVDFSGQANVETIRGLASATYSEIETCSGSDGINFTAYDRCDYDLDNSSNVIITLYEPAGTEWATKLIKFKQGSLVQTTNHTWATAGSSNVYWAYGSEPAWPTGPNDVFWVTFLWDGSHWYGMHSGYME